MGETEFCNFTFGFYVGAFDLPYSRKPAIMQMPIAWYPTPMNIEHPVALCWVGTKLDRFVCVLEWCPKLVKIQRTGVLWDA